MSAAGQFGRADFCPSASRRAPVTV